MHCRHNQPDQRSSRRPVRSFGMICLVLRKAAALGSMPWRALRPALRRFLPTRFVPCSRKQVNTSRGWNVPPAGCFAEADTDQSRSGDSQRAIDLIRDHCCAERSGAAIVGSSTGRWGGWCGCEPHALPETRSTHWANMPNSIMSPLIF